MSALLGMQSLYLCYFGVREPLVQTQVIPYLRQLAAAGADTTLLTFEPVHPGKWQSSSEEECAERLRGFGIRWMWRRYTKKPPVLSTLWDIREGQQAAAEFLRQNGPAVLHARGHWAAAMTCGLAHRPQSPLLFDIRGFAPEEYVDAGLWPSGGLLYRAAKRVEKYLLARAAGFVVLTQRAREILFPGCSNLDTEGRPFQVIPCCVDLQRFEPAWREDREALRAEYGLTGKKVYVYLGALGGWYLAEEMAGLFKRAVSRDAAASVLILTQSRPEIIAGPLQRLGVPAARFRVLQAPPSEVPRYLRACDVAVSFIKPSYSKLSSSPTKLAEYLAAGLPVLANSGVGDVDGLLRDERVGVILSQFDSSSYGSALDQMHDLLAEPDLSDRCRRAAARHFDLERVGGPRYVELYEHILSRNPQLRHSA